MNQKSILVALLLCGALAGTLSAEETNPVLGKTSDFVLREADLDRILAGQPPAVQKRLQDDPQQRVAVVREILIKKAIVARARKERFDKKPEIKEQLSYVFDDFISREYLAKVVTADVSVTEDELKKYYREHEKEFLLPEQITVRHILITAPKEATSADKEKARGKTEALLQRLNKGEDFAKLAKENSEDPISAPKGGELSPITLGKTNSEEFEKAAFALKPGELSGIVASSYGFHIIKLEQRREKRMAPFEEARDYISNKLKSELEQKKVREFLEQVTKEAGMEIYSDKDAAAQGNGPENGTATEIKK